MNENENKNASKHGKNVHISNLIIVDVLVWAVTHPTGNYWTSLKQTIRFGLRDSKKRLNS